MSKIQIDLISPYTLPAIGHNLSASAHFILYSNVLAGASKLHAKTHELDAANASVLSSAIPMTYSFTMGTFKMILSQ